MWTSKWIPVLLCCAVLQTTHGPRGTAKAKLKATYAARYALKTVRVASSNGPGRKHKPEAAAGARSPLPSPWLRDHGLAGVCEEEKNAH